MVEEGSSVVVLLSGGVDSLVCAERMLAAGRLAGCVFVDYGHPARQREAWRAFAWAERREVRLHVLHAMGLHLGEMTGERGASPQVVPARNAVLLAMAANVAASWGAGYVAIGANESDLADYPDCRPRFLDRMSKALHEACGVRVVAPLSFSTKPDIMQEAERHGIREGDAWACYGGGPKPCGACASCVAVSS